VVAAVVVPTRLQLGRLVDPVEEARVQTTLAVRPPQRLHLLDGRSPETRVETARLFVVRTTQVVAAVPGRQVPMGEPIVLQAMVEVESRFLATTSRAVVTVGWRHRQRIKPSAVVEEVPPFRRREPSRRTVEPVRAMQTLAVVAAVAVTAGRGLSCFAWGLLQRSIHSLHLVRLFMVQHVTSLLLQPPLMVKRFHTSGKKPNRLPPQHGQIFRVQHRQHIRYPLQFAQMMTKIDFG
jgi:hypothetical protein